MNTTKTFLNTFSPFQKLKAVRVRSLMFFGLLILVALVFFEMFNYSTTEYALKDLLGGLQFAGIPWSTLLAVAFCGLDFAGLARLFINQDETQISEGSKETWFLFSAWLLASIMNAMLTWWGVSMAIANHQIQSTTVINAEIVFKAVPIFIAAMVWVIRILIIGTLTLAGTNMLGFTRTPSYRKTAQNPNNLNRQHQPSASPIYNRPSARPSIPLTSQSAEASLTPAAANRTASFAANKSSRSDPTYHSL
jgi:hypothetical protein